MNERPTQLARYVVVALIWGGIFAMVGGMLVFGALQYELAGVMGAAGFIAAMVSTGVLFQWGQVPEAPKQSQQDADAGKRKNEQRGLDPVSLLTEEDLAELREDIKHDLRRRLLEDRDGELNSLDALIAEQDQRRR